MVLALLRQMRCPVCDEQRPPQPRNQTSWNVIPEKWEIMESDLAEWTHPQTEKKYKLIICCGRRPEATFGPSAGKSKATGTSADPEEMSNKFHSLFNDVDGSKMVRTDK